MYIYLFIFLFFVLSFNLFLFFFLCSFSFYILIYSFIYLFIYFFVCLFIYLITYLFIYLFVCLFVYLFIYLFTYLLSQNCDHWRRQRPKWKVNTEQRDKIGVAVQSWLWERVELMAWQLSRLECLNGIQWLWVSIPLRPTFYSHF